MLMTCLGKRIKGVGKWCSRSVIKNT
jgi:hypothetical protein